MKKIYKYKKISTGSKEILKLRNLNERETNKTQIMQIFQLFTEIYSKKITIIRFIIKIYDGSQDNYIF